MCVFSGLVPGTQKMGKNHLKGWIYFLFSEYQVFPHPTILGEGTGAGKSNQAEIKIWVGSFPAIRNAETLNIH